MRAAEACKNVSETNCQHCTDECIGGRIFAIQNDIANSVCPSPDSLYIAQVAVQRFQEMIAEAKNG